MIRRRAAQLLALAVLAAFLGDLLLASWAAEVVAASALLLALCCLPDRGDE